MVIKASRKFCSRNVVALSIEPDVSEDRAKRRKEDNGLDYPSIFEFQ